MARIKVKGERVHRSLRRLWRNTLGNLQPLQKQIGELIVGVTKQAWRDQADPATGHPWPSLSPGYAAWKKKKKFSPDILVRSNNLRKSIHAAIIPQVKIEVGTNVPYGPAHQFGTGGSSSGRSGAHSEKLPARPFLGLSPSDERDIENLMARYFSGRINAS